MKVIFLDVDGVLNCRTSKSRCGNIIGVDKDKVKRLAKIVEVTDAKIVLCSSWRESFDKSARPLDNEGEYLAKHLWNHGKVRIATKTKYIDGSCRGTEIKTWLTDHANWNITHWAVLDDSIFDDYDDDICKRLIQTSYDVGLTDDDVGVAIKMLGE